LNQESKFGAFLDPVADKLIVAVALVVMVGNPHLPYLALPAAVIIGREIAISALREWMAEIGERTSVAVSFVGKMKTVLQIVAIIVLLACNPLYPGFLFYAGYVLLYLAAILTLWSMVMYLKAAWPSFEI
jgi:CDP-diacylglycerol--glycerol-3-phosphate 3-phosphatidyltransferase